MKLRKLSELIIEEGTEDRSVDKERKTVRAIIIKHQKLLLVYSKKFLDYTFPGGGVKLKESLLEALKRELNEELGAKKVLSARPYGLIQEKRYGINSDTVYLQTSYYFFVDIDGVGKQNLRDRELDHGVEPTWVTLDEAIKQNLQARTTYHHQKGMKTVLPRELEVLKRLKEDLKELF